MMNDEHNIPLADAAIIKKRVDLNISKHDKSKNKDNDIKNSRQLGLLLNRNNTHISLSAGQSA
eukprot:scaffold8224_cov90-Alexandrium_tamarense.AAC.1